MSNKTIKLKDAILEKIFELDSEYEKKEFNYWSIDIISQLSLKTTQKEINDFLEVLILDGHVHRVKGITISGKEFYRNGGYRAKKRKEAKDPKWILKILTTALIGGIITIIIKFFPSNERNNVLIPKEIKDKILPKDTIITIISPSAMENPDNNEFEIISQQRTYDLREAAIDTINRPVTCYEYLLIKKNIPTSIFKLQYSSSGYIQFQKNSKIKDVYVHAKLDQDSLYTLRNYHVNYDVSGDSVGQKIEIHYALKYLNTFFSKPTCGLGDCIDLKVLKKTKKLGIIIYYDNKTFGGNYKRYYYVKKENEYKEFEYIYDDLKKSATDSALIWNISEILPPPVNYRITFNYK